MKSKNNWPEGEYTYIGSDGCNYDSPEEWIVIGLCGICGCGDDRLKEDIIKVFEKVAKKKVINRDDLYIELILNVLTNADLLEHGTSICWSWLTEKGKKALKEINKKPFKNRSKE